MSALSDLEEGSDLVVSNSSVCSNDAESAGGIEYESNVQVLPVLREGVTKQLIANVRLRSPQTLHIRRI